MSHILLNKDQYFLTAKKKIIIPEKKLTLINLIYIHVYDKINRIYNKRINGERFKITLKVKFNKYLTETFVVLSS